MTYTQLRIHRLEDEIAEQQRAKDRGELLPFQDRTGTLGGEVARLRKQLAREIAELNDSKVATRNGWIVVFATVVFVVACLALAVRSIRWRPAPTADPVASGAA